ncbi:universal stress protein [Corynebacterium bovis]|uniref:Universal stress protein n=2 Tax=Corynebacterium bovis TaxID=36808 RepID=A0A426PWG6_9CORY|nr:universal stress protein [Corynebacterium bovis]MBB3115843.1 nucleotide-binding universal stress UspA family protein [Corynebacterium bovis DSM 20582 = CIP 54.80]MDK8511624.1 universal stress protein [Corynebacterium bovis]MDN8580084.1 universal stress protein [Corynebacterium bovis]QQC46808.1 universal stress protein [Corynebacterium bovis]RRO80746.1 universal stress protein [Corynebacterium bovis]
MSANSSTRSIVIAVDGSPAGAVAVQWAANAAAKRKQGVKLVTAYTIPQFLYADGMVPPQELFDELETEAMDKVDAAREAVLAVDPDIPVSHRVEESNPIDLLLEESREAEMIVMGSRGLGGFSGLVLGSVSSAVVSHAECPVVILRKDSGVCDETKYGPVVVGVDGSDVSRDALHRAFEEADARGATLRAVHSWSDAELSATLAGLATALDRARDEEQALLHEELKPLCEQYPNVKVEAVVERDRPVPALIDNAEDAQLLVVGSRGRGGFKGMVLGSSSRALLQYSPCPLMVVRPTGRTREH